MEITRLTTVLDAADLGAVSSPAGHPFCLCWE
jgi:hypothetical protein